MQYSKSLSAYALFVLLAGAPGVFSQNVPAVAASGELQKQFPQIRALLADPDESNRQAGQKLLDALNPDQIPALTALANAENNPEVRAHLEQAINDLSVYVLTHPKPLTIHLSDVPSEQICQEISKQLGEGYNVTPGRMIGNYSLQADNLPFWEVISRIEGNPPVGLNYSNTILSQNGKLKADLVPRSTDTRQTQIIGCFKLESQLTQTENICSINIAGVVEPRLRITQYSNVLFDSLKDASGKEYPIASISPSAGMTSLNRADYYWYSKASFEMPEGVEKVTELRGHINLALLEKEESLMLDFSHEIAPIETSRGRVVVEKMTAGHYIIRFTPKKTDHNPASLSIPPAPVRTYMRVLNAEGKEIQTQVVDASDPTLVAYATVEPPAKAEIFWPQSIRTTTVPFVVTEFNPRQVDPIRSTWENPETVTKSTDVDFLEKIASSFDAGKSLKPEDGLIGKSSLDLRIAAYARLGEIGTPQALAAVDRIEDKIVKLAKTNITPAKVSLGTWRFPTLGSSTSELKPLITFVAPDKTTYQIIWRPIFYGATDMLLVSSKTSDDPTSWSRPVLLPNQPEPMGTVFRGDVLNIDAAGALKLDYSKILSNRDVEPHSLQTTLEEIYRDTDKDGWTDIEEARLGLDPKKADTDGDGIPDGQDTCPDYAPPADAGKDPNLELIQKAFFAAFGFSESRNAIIVSPSSLKIQLQGYAGPILYNIKNPPPREPKATPRFIQARWDIPEIIGDTAKVSIGDYVSPTGATGQTTLLKKINGKWYVISHKLTMIS